MCSLTIESVLLQALVMVSSGTLLLLPLCMLTKILKRKTPSVDPPNTLRPHLPLATVPPVRDNRGRQREVPPVPVPVGSTSDRLGSGTRGGREREGRGGTGEGE